MDCNVRCFAIVIFVAIIATPHSSGAGCLGLTSGDPHGRTSPDGDIYIKYGDPLRITCNVISSVYNSSSIVFRRTFHAQNKSELVDFKHVTIINDTAAELFILKPPPTQDEVFTCCIKYTNFTEEFDNRTAGICVNSVTVGFPPQDVSNLSCVSHNWDSLNCSWKAPNNFDTTEYSISYVVNGASALCPNVTKVKDWYNCIWTRSTKPIYRNTHPMILLVLNATNKFGRKTWNKSINHYASVIPDRPRDLTGEASARSITVSWHIPAGLETFPPGLVYEVQYRCPYTNWKLLGPLVKTKGASPISVVLDNLYSYTEYEILVRCRSGKNIESNLWSEYAIESITTKPLRPNRAPRTDIGSFEVSSPINGLRNVSLYWQKIERYEENGRNLHYKVVKVEKNGIREAITETRKDDWSISYSRLTDDTYKFYITSCNDEGDAPDTSEIFIPSSKSLPPLPEAVTKLPYANGTYEISWRRPKRDDLTGFTIFWCENKSDLDQCSGTLNWAKVNRNVYSKTIDLSKSGTQYQFAVSAEIGSLSSGLSWVSCTIYQNGIKGANLKAVQPVSIGSKIIRLSWKPAECADKISVISGYRITYCLVPVDNNCADDKNCDFSCSHEYINDPSAMHGNLTNLEPYSLYRINVSAVSIYDQVVFGSDYIEVTTLEDSPDQMAKVVKTSSTNDSISIAWTYPNRTNGIIRKFIVYGAVIPIVVPPGETYITLKGLRSGTPYNISVSACTKTYKENDLCSKPSEIVSIWTDVGCPAAPEKLILTRINNIQQNLNWFSPESNVSFYEVNLTVYSEIPHYYLSNTSSLQKKLEINECDEEDSANLKISVKVRAVNIGKNKALLYGNWSDTIEGGCNPNDNKQIFIIIGVFVGFICFILLSAVCIWLWRLAWLRCKDMSKVVIKLPERLNPRREVDKTDGHSLEHLQNTKPSPDQQRLLSQKLKEELDEEGTCADESGCGSGQESVSSVISDARISADSGTEADSGEQEGTPPPTMEMAGTSGDNRGSPYVSLQPPGAAVARSGYVTIAPPFGTSPVTPDPGYVIVGTPSSPLPISPVPVSPLPVNSPHVISPVAASYCVLGLKHPGIKSVLSFPDCIQDDVVPSLHSN